MTDAWNDGFLGECVNAGPDRCALATLDQDEYPSRLDSLQARMNALFKRILLRPIPAYSSKYGPGIVTYEHLIKLIYESLYNPYTWPGTAAMLADLEKGNATRALEAISSDWGSNYTRKAKEHSSEELGMMVICADAFDAPRQPIEWWLELQANMTRQ